MMDFFCHIGFYDIQSVFSFLVLVFASSILSHGFDYLASKLNVLFSASKRCVCPPLHMCPNQKPFAVYWSWRGTGAIVKEMVNRLSLGFLILLHLNTRPLGLLVSVLGLIVVLVPLVRHSTSF